MREAADAQSEIRDRIRDVNAAWLGGDLAGLKEHFHPQIVMVAPGFSGRVSGAEPCRKSFEDFLEAANVLDFRESELDVDVFGSTAVATFRFDITYVLDGNEHTEAGREIWIFAQGVNGWRAVWRAQMPIA